MDTSQPNTSNAAHHFGFPAAGMNTVNTDWPYSNHSMPSDIGHQQTLLQEPGPFEDFQFSFGLDPTFAIPVPLDMAPFPLGENDALPVNDQLHTDLAHQSQIMHTQPVANNALLNEDDQRAFFNFLDSVIVDPHTATVEPLANHHQPLCGPQKYPATFTEEQDDEKRRISILRALDERKQIPPMSLAMSQTMTDLAPNKDMRHMLLDNVPNGQTSHWGSWGQQDRSMLLDNPTNSMAYPHHSDTAMMPRLQPTQSDRFDLGEQSPRKGTGPGPVRPTKSRRGKPLKELLTEEEKRANHIASEQRRRGTIRNGFQDLVNTIPALKNANHSKSVVLFKAVEYIRYLDQRNKRLRDKVAALKVRHQVQQSLSRHPKEKSTSSPPLSTPLTTDGHNSDCHDTSAEHTASSPSSSPLPTSTANKSDNAAASAAEALRIHKLHQSNLLKLQDQLQQHQKMLVGGACAVKHEDLE